MLLAYSPAACASFSKAAELYQRILMQNPGFKDEEIDQHLRLANAGSSSDDEEEELSSQKYFMEKPKLKFSDVGGDETRER